MKDKDKYIRIEAAMTLGKIGAKRTEEPLIQALQDQSNDVRVTAAKALAGAYQE